MALCPVNVGAWSGPSCGIFRRLAAVWVVLTGLFPSVAFAQAPVISQQPAGATVNALSAGSIVATAGGFGHTLFLTNDGALWAVGYNGAGQLGDGTITKRNAPVQVATGTASMAAGTFHSLFVKTDGTLWAMGANQNGQLGDGTSTTRRTPVQVATGVAAAATGGIHSLFVKTDGTLWAMGYNAYGQLGDGTTTNRSTPVQVATDVASIAAGESFGLFAKTDGTLWVMGSNIYGQLGDGTTISRSTPVQVAADVVSVAAGSNHCFFVKTDGTLWAMGNNFNGQLGDGTTVSRNTPVQVAADVASASAGANHSVFVGNDGTLRAMGDNYHGQLGDGTTTNRSTPVQVAADVASAAAGGDHSVFVGNDGTLRAAGDNYFGQLGDGSFIDRSSPIRVGSITLTVAATGAEPLSYQWKKDGVDIVGATAATLTIANPQTADAGSYMVVVSNASGDTTSNAATVTVNVPPSIQTHPVSQTVSSAGQNVTFSVVASGTSPLNYQWRKDGVDIPGATSDSLQIAGVQVSDAGDYTVRVGNVAGAAEGIAATLTVNLPPVITVQPVAAIANTLGVRSVVDAAAGYNHSLFLADDGTLWALGINQAGQLGDGTTTLSTAPKQAATGVSSLAAGYHHSLFVKTDGTLWAMGNNWVGQLGDGTTGDRSTPVQVATDVASSSAGFSHSLFVKTDGTLWAMGYNTDGQLGDGTTTNRWTPVQVASDVASVAAGGYHSLFVKTDGTLWAMGSNLAGQLGDGTTVPRSTPVQVTSGVASVTAGEYHSLFVKTDGTLWSMGNNDRGGLGDGTTTNQNTPVQVASGVASVAAGNYHSLFVKTDETLWATGANWAGQLGDGTIADRSTPVQVATGVSSAAGGWAHGLFVKTDGTLWATGLNQFGQLGDGTLVDRTLPVRVGSVTLIVSAIGPGPLTYQWKKDGVDIVGATSSTYVLETPQSADAGSYSVVVTNAFGSTTSIVVMLGVNVAPSITTHPMSQTIETTGQDVTFSVVATGTTPLAYQWQKDGQDIAGATSDSYQIIGVDVSHAGNYTARVSNEGGAVVSNAATLTVNLSPVIATQPTSATVNTHGTGTVIAAAAGSEHALFLVDDGTLFGMGSNGWGELGDGTNTNRNKPVQIAKGVVSMAAGRFHSMFVKADGTLWATGYNWYGQLGDGTTTDRNAPVQVATDVVSAAAGYAHSLFVKSNGTLWATGYNASGQLGDGTTAWRNAPVQVATDVAFVAAGGFHSLFVKTDGTLWAMGSNQNGQLGDGTGNNSSSPVQIASGVASAAAGEQHSLFLKTDGTLWAMGNNDIGQLGDGTPVMRSTPILVSSDVTSLAAGGFHTLFVRTNGTLWGIGSNTFGQLGDGTSDSRSTAVQVATGVSSVFTGRVHSLFVKTDGTLWGMGSNDYGQLGDEISGSRYLPIPIGAVTLTVEAIGPGPLSYQWQKDGEDIIDAISATYFISSPAADDAGSYTVVVTNPFGNVTSTSAILIVNVPPSIQTQPASQAVAGTGHTATFSVVASGTAPLTYQWRKDGAIIPGATSDIYQKLNVQVFDAGKYTVMVGNIAGVLLSDAATLTVNLPPEITGQPTAVTTNTIDMRTVVAASGGLSHTMFLADDGSLWAIGDNANNQLGDGSTFRRPWPVRVATEVASMSAGSNHSLFVKTDGTLWATGDNTLGQLGDGTTTNRWRPVQIASGVASALAGKSHSLFVRTDGTLWAMGYNQFGQLGDGTTTNRSTPVQVATGVASAKAGDFHSLFVKTDGTLWAMGYNYINQLGDGTFTNQTTPVQVATGVASAAAGNAHSLFVKTDGTLWAMGSNQSGQLGDGTFDNRGTPVQVSTGVSTVAAGHSHSMFVKTDGTLWVVGNNSYGQLGDGSTAWRSTPVQVATDVSSASAGGFHSLFVKNDGTLWAMGHNLSGELGDGTLTDRTSPVRVGLVMLSVTAIGEGPLTYQWKKNGVEIVGATSATYVLETPQAADAGSYSVVVTNAFGSVTSNTVLLEVKVLPSIVTQPVSRTVNSSNVDVTFSVVASGTAPFQYQWRKDGVDIPAANSSDYQILAVESSDAGNYSVRVGNEVGAVVSDAALLTVILGPSIVVQPASRTVNTLRNRSVIASSGGDGHSVFLTDDGMLWAMGDNQYGQLGDGTTTQRLLPVQVAYDVASVSASGNHTLFLKTDGTLWATGDNQYGQLGDGTTTQRSLPVQMAEGVASMSAGATNSLFVKTDGTLWAAGGNTYGQLGDGTTSNRLTPVQIATDIETVSAGSFHSLFLKIDGTLWSMGVNWAGQLGDGTKTNRLTPVQVSGGVASVAAGGFHTLFVKTDGTLWAMGYNQYGQVGDGMIADRIIPVQVAGDVASVAAGNSHSLFVKMDGTLWAMGFNTWGQIGDGTTTSRSTPVQVAGEVASTSAGAVHSHFVNTEGALWVVGNNAFGQLGDGTLVDRALPIRVGSLTLTVEAAGLGPYTYQWKKGGVNIAGATADTFTIASVQLADAGDYTVVVANEIASTTSSVATLTVGSEPEISSPPADTGAAIGGSANFNVTATGIGPFTYQWQRDGADIPGANAATFTLNNAQESDVGSYAVVVKNSIGRTTSEAATFIIADPPTIDSQPTNQSIAIGGRVTFTVTATSELPTSYQWRRNGINIAGATSPTLTLSDVQTSNAGIYTVVATNNAGSTTSAGGVLNVDTTPRLINLSIRGDAGGGGSTLVMGFYISGTTPKTVLLRGIGPKLADYGVNNVVSDPSLTVYSGATVIGENNNWDSSLEPVFQAAGAFLLDPGSKDAALVLTLAPGGYTIHLMNSGATAQGLIEAYDVSRDAGSRFTNLSCRSNLLSGDIVIMGAAVLGGDMNLLVRNAGPGLAPYLLPDDQPLVLPDPMLRVYRGSSVVAEDDDWDSLLAPYFASAGAFSMAEGSTDAAYRISANPGGYTIHGSGNGAGGIALVELYESN